MSQQSNVQNINFSTAFSIDKICGVLSNTFTASTFNLGGYLYQYSIPHNFTRPIFCDALFSSDGTNYVPNGQADTTYSYNVYSDSSNIYLLTTANSGTFYYKEVSTWIDNYDTTNPLISPVFQTTLPTQDTTYFDSRKNYQKIYKENVITFAAAGGTQPIAHNLGYISNYKIFFESLPGQVWPSISGGAQDIWFYSADQHECYGVMDSSNLTITVSSGTASCRVWYRIYYDS